MVDLEKEALAYGGAIYWYDEDTSSWFRYETKSGVWRSDKSSLEKPKEWRPWTKLVDTSCHPYISWFQGAKSNMTYSTLDCHVQQGYGQDIAFECLSFNVSTGTEDITKLNRQELLAAVEFVAAKLHKSLCTEEVYLERCVFHCRVTLEHVVYVLACARLAIVYSCTALDISDGSLDYRVQNFSPTFGVASPDGGSQNEIVASRLRTFLRDGQEMHIVDSNSIHGYRRSTSTLYKNVQPIPLSDYRPLCVVYTSGSTGKPKGAVHGHCGYTACVSRSMQHVFSITRQDRFMAIATLAWITGQSYMLTGPLVAGCTSILIQGSALGVDGIRWARIARDFDVTILKAASAFVRHCRVSEERSHALKQMNLRQTLRMATFCAEPVSPEVQSWACDIICQAFINSYWATEHGSIIMSRPLDFKVDTYVPDTKCWPVPWVYVQLSQAPLAKNENNEQASPENNHPLHDIVLTKPYAGLIRTVWGDLENYSNQKWRGDYDRLAKSYFPSLSTDKIRSSSFESIDFGFVQGDAARLDPLDNGWTFHGRSDEVLNVAGVRVGVGEIEHVLWQLNVPLSETYGFRVGELAVVGGPDEVKGEVPIIFAMFEAVDSNSSSLHLVVESFLGKWRELTRHHLGSHAEPGAVLPCLGLPKTITGKITRELLRRALRGIITSVSDIQRSVVNEIAYWDCVKAAVMWRREIGLVASIDLDVKANWKLLDFSGHVIAGEALLPAAGWLEIFRRVFYLTEECMHLSSIEYMKGTKASNICIDSERLRARKESANQIVVGTDTDPTVYVRAKFTAQMAEQDYCTRLSDENVVVIDDYGIDVHQRRCSSVGLDYSGAFRCVRRVIWKNNGVALIDVVARNTAALIDSGLQVLCSVDAISNGRSMIPYAISSFSLLQPEKFYTDAATNDILPKRWLVIAEIVSRQTTSLVGNVYYYRWEQNITDDLRTVELWRETPAAVIRGVSLSQFGSSTNVTESILNNDISQTSLSSVPKRSESDILKVLVDVGSEIVGNRLDPDKNLFENGLHSLRIVEFVTQLKSTYGIQLSPRDFVSVSTFADLTHIIQQQYNQNRPAINGATTSNDKFDRIDFGALERIFATFHTNSEAENVGERASPTGNSDIFRVFTYMLRRGFFRYMRIQYNDGLFEFFLRPPLRLNLYAIVIVSGPRVTFSQTDYNRHFTVREIIKDSERGFYNLLHRTGLAYLEHYYRVMFFASRLDAKFDLELLEGQRYYMRSHISNINGPLVDVDVAFHNGKTGMRAFVVKWRLMLVVDAESKRMYDFEIGGAFASADVSAGSPSSSTNKILDFAHIKKSNKKNNANKSPLNFAFYLLFFSLSFFFFLFFEGAAQYPQLGSCLMTKLALTLRILRLLAMMLSFLHDISLLLFFSPPFLFRLFCASIDHQYDLNTTVSIIAIIFIFSLDDGCSFIKNFLIITVAVVNKYKHYAASSSRGAAVSKS